MMTKEGSTKIKKKIITPGKRVLDTHKSNIVKMYYFIKKFLLYIRAWISQTMYMYIVMMTKEGPTQNVNLMTPTTGVFVLRHGYMSHIVNMHCLQSTLSICSTLIVVVHVFRGS